MPIKFYYVYVLRSLKDRLFYVGYSDNLRQRVADHNKGKNISTRNYWYADYKNDKFHYIIYKDKIFKVDLTNPILYKEAKRYGVSLGIPEYQVDFAPDDKVWKR